MHKKQTNLAFSQLVRLNNSNIARTPDTPSLYMICKKDNYGQNQVIFAGVAYNLKSELTEHHDRNLSDDGLSFCYIPTSAKNVLKNSKSPLYQRVA